MSSELFIDLHAHTTASDGSLSPTELVRKAAAEGLSALAVTDHDTIAGLSEARDEAKRAGIELVSGMELSVKWDEGTFHLLGYLFEEGPGLAEGLAKLQALRHDRNLRMVAKMIDLGVGITYDEVVAESGGGQVGRPHMAKALIKKGHAASVHDAFEKLLRRGKPAYVVVDRLEPEDAFSLVRRAGGVPVVAHPYQLKLKDAELEARVAEWKKSGLGGIEVQHSSHDASRQSFLDGLAKRHDLAATGGSDFHGETKPEVQLGRAGGGARIPLSRLDELKRRR